MTQDSSAQREAPVSTSWNAVRDDAGETDRPMPPEAMMLAAGGSMSRSQQTARTPTASFVDLCHTSKSPTALTAATRSGTSPSRRNAYLAYLNGLDEA